MTSGGGHRNIKRHLRKNESVLSLVPKDSIEHHLRDYCSGTSIHGIKYLGERNRPLGERLWWVIVLTLSFIGNAYLISKVWSKWNQSPVIVSFAETTTPVWQVPFPSVTICPEIKSKASVFSFFDALKKQEANETLDEETRRQLADVSVLCDRHIKINGSDTLNQTSIDFLFDVAPSMEETFVVCFFDEVLVPNCTDIFYPVFTEEGLCYSFNMLSPKELFRGNGVPFFYDHGRMSEGWSLDEGYPPNIQLKTYPQRALAAGIRAGLLIVVRYNIDDADYYCRGPVQGFKVLLHNPAEFPTVGERFFRVPTKQEVVMAITPNIMTTSDGLRPYSPQRRQCFFHSERYLRHFKVYSQRNCEIECLSNHTLAACGCVALHMPRVEGTPICGSRKKACVNKANEDLRLLEIQATFSERGSSKCDCLPACTSIQYDAETTQADFNYKEVIAANADNATEYQKIYMSRLSIFFKDMQFTTSRRSELFGTVDFLANCGGLLGLFCGVSLLSLVEILYYFTLRLWSNMRRHKDKVTRNDINKFSSSESKFID